MSISFKDIRKAAKKSKEIAGSSKSESEEKKEIPALVLNPRPDFGQNLDYFKLKIDTGTVHYIPEYLTEDEEKLLLEHIYSQPVERWSFLKYASRRLQKWGGTVMAEGLQDPEPLPGFLQPIAERLENDGVLSFCPNHVLLNEYPPNIGIMPHEDGPLYTPQVAILSIKSYIILNFWKKEGYSKEATPDYRLLLEPRSLMMFQDTLYTDYFHGIEERSHDFVSHKSLDQSEDRDAVVSNLSYLNEKTLARGEQVGDDLTRLTRKTRVSLTLRKV